jgi:hypothetical protein
MNIEAVIGPPTRKRARARTVYGPLIEALDRPGQWLRVSLTEITGKNPHDKQAAVTQAARKAGISIRTRTVADYIYICRHADKAEV